MIGVLINFPITNSQRLDPTEVLETKAKVNDATAWLRQNFPSDASALEDKGKGYIQANPGTAPSFF